MLHYSEQKKHPSQAHTQHTHTHTHFNSSLVNQLCTSTTLQDGDSVNSDKQADLYFIIYLYALLYLIKNLSCRALWCFLGDLRTFPTIFLALLIPEVTWFHLFKSGLHPTFISVWGWLVQQSTAFFYSLAASSFLSIFMGSWSISVQDCGNENRYYFNQTMMLS